MDEQMKTPDEMQAEWDAAIKDAGVPTEAQMRDAAVPWPQNEEELVAYIRTLVDRPHDYGTCVYAMSMAAVATFKYVAHRLGVTGFQSSCADMDILRRTRSIKHGFRIFTYDNLLYPQYWDGPNRAVYEEALSKKRDEFRKVATELLLENPKAHPDVLEHWKRIAGEP